MSFFVTRTLSITQGRIISTEIVTTREKIGNKGGKSERKTNFILILK